MAFGDAVARAWLRPRMSCVNLLRGLFLPTLTGPMSMSSLQTGSNMMASHSNEIALVAATVRDRWPGCSETAGERIRLVLIADDPIATSGVRARLLARVDFEVIGEASSVENALNMLATHQPDAIFVNAEMMESLRFDVARLLCQPVKPVIVIIATHKRYALQAFDLGAADYLLKPICDDRLDVCLKRVRDQLANRRSADRNVEKEPASFARASGNGHSVLPRITVTDRKRTHVIETKDIDWVGAAGDYTELHVRGTTHLLREPLSVLLGRLPAHAFCRIHRSSAVNLTRVSGFKTLRNQDLLVKLKDRTVLRASRTFSDELRKAIALRCA